MTINDILNAKESLAKLNKVKFNDFKVVSNVYKLTKKVNGVLEMVTQEQLKILDLYSKKDPAGKPLIENGQYQFESIENRDKFIDEITSLKKSEVDDIDKIDIRLDSIQFASDFTPEEMLALDPLINWID